MISCTSVFTFILSSTGFQFSVTNINIAISRLFVIFVVSYSSNKKFYFTFGDVCFYKKRSTVRCGLFHLNIQTYK